jgi:hypothetical protein
MILGLFVGDAAGDWLRLLFLRGEERNRHTRMG